MSDTTIANVALPSIQQGAHASSGALEWVVSGYALTFGLALVPAARLGDRYGYKRLFLTGLSLFTLASVACGVSQNAGELIIARLVQGLGAGIYYPAVSAIIQRLFTGKDRSRAFGYLGGVVGVSTAAGPLLGGLLVQLAGVTDGWRWVFLVNLFIGIAALPVAFRLLPSRHDPEEHRLDPAGNLLLAAVLLLILIPLVEGRVSGWPAWSWLLLGLAVPVRRGPGGLGAQAGPPRRRAGHPGRAAARAPATLVNLCFIALALACAFGLPARLAGQNQEPEAETAPGEGDRQAPRTAQSGAGVPTWQAGADVPT
jgi:MFS family permease